MMVILVLKQLQLRLAAKVIRITNASRTIQVQLPTLMHAMALQSEGSTSAFTASGATVFIPGCSEDVEFVFSSLIEPLVTWLR